MLFRIKVNGRVQGVGFRPFVYRKAIEMGVSGFVRNRAGHVEIVCDDESFSKILSEAPPMAIVQSFSVEEFEGESEGFRIIPSEGSYPGFKIPPDIGVCEDCIAEVRNKADRRHGYHFTTCTNCGPRYSMTEDFRVPYDRDATTMGDFQMCQNCRNEYENPLNRRYHAQTIACPDCGPDVKLEAEGKILSSGPDAISAAAKLVLSDSILAVKGIGGYHLCCMPSKGPIKKLRKITGRPDKPFALMASSLDEAKKFCHMGPEEAKMLKSPQKPILVLEKRDSSLMRDVSELSSLGLMLPYTALHHLLCDAVKGPLVMTSANMPGSPTAIKKDEIPKGTDALLDHDRRIAIRCDDSVARFAGTGPRFLRRARGYVPDPVPIGGPDMIAFGAMWENTICVSKDKRAYCSQYIGSHEDEQSLRCLKQMVSDYVSWLEPDIRTVLCDLHPDIQSLEMARDIAFENDADLIRVQHHLAHVCSAAQEHGLDDFVGIACDGYGYGADGSAWGGEVFDNCQRVASLESHRLIGGDMAAKEPMRMLYSMMSSWMGEDELLDCGLFPEHSGIWARQLKQGFNCMPSTSCGRVLDAVSALLGNPKNSTYRGRHPMLLESMAKGKAPYSLKPSYSDNGGLEILETAPLIRFIYEMRKKASAKRLAATAHHYLARGLSQMAKSHASERPIVFSGGVAYNRLFCDLMKKNGILMNRVICPGDGGISFGQAAYAGIFCGND